ncbi:extensin-like [Malania oleifera]|uniref:extensin-like n=1 Tax=Malania oleifera TaxID=397392 RepID=UPI0025ADE53E|nr:extensin-like [Malania oleifera]
MEPSLPSESDVKEPNVEAAPYSGKIIGTPDKEGEQTGESLIFKEPAPLSSSIFFLCPELPSIAVLSLNFSLGTTIGHPTPTESLAATEPLHRQPYPAVKLQRPPSAAPAKARTPAETRPAETRRLQAPAIFSGKPPWPQDSMDVVDPSTSPSSLLFSSLSSSHPRRSPLPPSHHLSLRPFISLPSLSVSPVTRSPWQPQHRSPPPYPSPRPATYPLMETAPGSSGFVNTTNTTVFKHQQGRKHITSWHGQNPSIISNEPAPSSSHATLAYQSGVITRPHYHHHPLATLTASSCA